MVETSCSFEQKLRDIESQISPISRFSVKNLKIFVELRWFSRYLQFHISWHQCHCDNYRLFLAGYQEAAPMSLLEQINREYIHFAEQECFLHASSMINIFSAVLDLEIEFPLLDMDIAICAYHCARLLIYMSHSDAFKTESGLREKAYICLQLVKKLFGASKLTFSIVSNGDSIPTYQVNNSVGT